MLTVMPEHAALADHAAPARRGRTLARLAGPPALAVCLALVFARMGSIIPKVGGPYAYAREGFGDFAGFWVAWAYSTSSRKHPGFIRGWTRYAERSMRWTR